MSRRSRAREIALQALFQEDLNPENALGNLGAFLAARLQEEEMREFAKALEEVCVATVEGGQMTKDLALLVGPDQEWLTTEEFLAALDENLQRRLGA